MNGDEEGGEKPWRHRTRSEARGWIAEGRGRRARGSGKRPGDLVIQWSSAGAGGEGMGRRSEDGVGRHDLGTDEVRSEKLEARS